MNLFVRVLVAVIAFVAVAEALVFARSILFQSERPPIGADQLGYRGTGLVNVYNPREREALIAANQVPHSVPYGGVVG